MRSVNPLIDLMTSLTTCDIRGGNYSDKIKQLFVYFRRILKANQISNDIYLFYLKLTSDRFTEKMQSLKSEPLASFLKNLKLTDLCNTASFRLFDYAVMAVINVNKSVLLDIRIRCFRENIVFFHFSEFYL